MSEAYCRKRGEILRDKGFGIVFDIGTTTLAGELVELEGCKGRGMVSVLNPQIEWGRDVLSRVQNIMEKPELLTMMQGSVVEGLMEITRRLLPEDGEKVERLIAVGNPVMEHILLGISPVSIGKVPYRPQFKKGQSVSSNRLGLDRFKGAELYVFPVVSGFIGGDAIAVAMYTNLHTMARPALVIDIGTNTEIIVKSPKGLFVSSAAAGPAFEGGGINCGMMADRGAIQGMTVKGDRVVLDVIDNVQPRGICGSGLLSAVSRLLVEGIVDSSGRIKGRDEVANNIANRIRKEEDGNSFILYRGERGEIKLTQQDVRALQLAKSAIGAGIKLLMKRAGVGAEEIETVYVAGAFGSNLKKDDLVTTGLLDSIWLDRTIFIGDAALKGAKLALCSREKRKEAEVIGREARYLSLSGSSHFQEEFMTQMNF